MHTNTRLKKIMSVYLPLVCLALILSSAMASTPVFDSDGDEVRAGVEYKIYSLLGPGRVQLALKLNSTGNTPCPLDVVLAGFQECLFQPCGLPVTFYPREGSLVSLLEDVNIKFDVTTECPESTVWQVVFDESFNREYVSTGGVLGPQKLTTSWFTIRSAGLTFPNVYNLVYCHRIENYQHVAAGQPGECGTLGFDGNDPRFYVRGLGGNSFQFIIIKATATTLLSSVV